MPVLLVQTVQMQFLDRVIVVPVAVQRHVPMVFDAVQFLDKVIDVPVAAQRHVPMVFEAVQFLGKVIDVPVAVQRHVPMAVQTVQFSPSSGEPVEIPQAQFSCLVSCSHRSWTSVYARCYADTRGDSTKAVLRQGF